MLQFACSCYSSQACVRWLLENIGYTVDGCIFRTAERSTTVTFWRAVEYSYKLRGALGRALACMLGLADFGHLSQG